MITPTTWTLNVRGLSWLNEEANRWFTIVANASGADRADAKAYLNAVLAERDQRLKQYSGGLWGTVQAGLGAPFEALGGSGGAGAPGAASGVADTLSSAASGAGKIAGNVAMIAAVGLVLAALLYFNVKKGAA